MDNAKVFGYLMFFHTKNANSCKKCCFHKLILFNPASKLHINIIGKQGSAVAHVHLIVSHSRSARTVHPALLALVDITENYYKPSL